MSHPFVHLDQSETTFLMCVPKGIYQFLLNTSSEIESQLESLMSLERDSWWFMISFAALVGLGVCWDLPSVMSTLELDKRGGTKTSGSFFRKELNLLLYGGSKNILENESSVCWSRPIRDQQYFTEFKQDSRASYAPLSGNYSIKI